MISPGKSSIGINDIKDIVSESQLVYHYLGITKIPCVINSPLRPDNNPSFYFYSPNGSAVNYIDFATGESGRLFTLLSKLWNLNRDKVYEKIYKDFISKSKDKSSTITYKKSCKISNKKNSSLECKIREWRKYDIEYWESYGISLKWLKYANIYPISHKIVTKEGRRYVFGADKYAYAFFEYKDNIPTIKIYQPYNKTGFKWANKHDKSVISLWTKVPKEGERICICSSLKDALCLWANTNIPAIAIQGEGYSISDTAINELKNRFKTVFILLDNDEAGLKDAVKLASKTGFINIVLPKIKGAKDISDLYKILNNKKEFVKIILDLFN